MLIPSQKHLFDIPQSHAYLNTAYMSPLMHSVADAMIEGTLLKKQPWTYQPDDFFTYPEIMRGLAGDIFETSADNIAIIPSTSYGIQIAANALSLSPGQTIIVLDEQFPSNIYPWQDKAQKIGAQLNILPTPPDFDWTREILAAINSETAILAVPQTHWASGATLDLAKIRTALDEVGAALVLDLTQSLGVQRLDLTSVRPDFAVAATYKWLMGPYSLGLLYIDPKWHKAAPLEHNWINRACSEDFTALTHYREGFQNGARKFDMGQRSNPGQLMGASAAMRQILDWGIDNISETLGEKTAYIAERLSAHGLSVLPRNLRAAHYLGLIFEQGVPTGLAAALSEKNIFVSVRGRAVRVTPHLYSSEADIERFISAIMSSEL